MFKQESKSEKIDEGKVESSTNLLWSYEQSTRCLHPKKHGDSIAMDILTT